MSSKRYPEESAYQAVSGLFDLLGNVCDAAFWFAIGPAKRQFPYRGKIRPGQKMARSRESSLRAIQPNIVVVLVRQPF